MMHPSQLCTTLRSKFSYKNIPSGLLLLNKRSRKKPATVGGSTMGRVRIPSMTAFFPGDALTTFLAAKSPRKNERIVATAPVFKEIHNGLQSRPFMISITVSITIHLLKSVYIRVKIVSLKHRFRLVRQNKFHKIRRCRALGIVRLIIYDLGDRIDHISRQIITDGLQNL